MNLLITGGAGFIGSHVVLNFLQRPEVKLLVNVDVLTYAGNLENLASIQNHKKYYFQQVDICDQHAIERILRDFSITHLLHLAAETHVDRSIHDSQPFLRTNVMGTHSLLEACRAFWPDSTGECRFHHVSTDEVFGSLGMEGYFNEQSPYAPRSPYAASKAASDMLARAYYHTYGLPIVITNCSNNFGPFQNPEKLIPLTISQVLRSQPIPVYGSGTNIRDWLYVAEHVEALWRVLSQGAIGETYLIGGQQEWTNLQIVEMICDLCDEILQRTPHTSRRLITFVKDRPGHDFRYAIDSRKIRGNLGWEPTHSFNDALITTVRWYLEP